MIRARIVLWRVRWAWIALAAAIALLTVQAALGSHESETPNALAKSIVAAGPARFSYAKAALTLSQARLKEADGLRRDGRVSEAIRSYSAVILTHGARLADVQSAKAWRARLRLERGESSAMDDLLELASSHLPPRLYAHVASSVLRANGAHDDVDSPATSVAVLRAVTHRLERASDVRGASGERAKWWLHRVRTRCATFFSQ
jgi:uncharacterized protein YdbL (DUF1318 family)